MEVNVENIMDEIREKIKEEGLDARKLSFEDIPPRSEDIGSDISDYSKDNLIKSCTYMNHHFEVSVWHPLYFSRPIVGPVHFNMHATRSMNQIRNYLIQKDNIIEESDKLIDEILVKQAQLSDRLAKLEQENAELRRDRN